MISVFYGFLSFAICGQWPVARIVVPVSPSTDDGCKLQVAIRKDGSDGTWNDDTETSTTWGNHFTRQTIEMRLIDEQLQHLLFNQILVGDYETAQNLELLQK